MIPERMPSRTRSCTLHHGIVPWGLISSQADPEDPPQRENLLEVGGIMASDPVLAGLTHFDASRAAKEQ